MDPDDELEALRAQAGEHAAQLRALALSVDAAPDRVDEHLSSPAMQAVRGLDPIALGARRTVAMLVELARGDAGMVLACPGPALAGVVTGIIGSPEQQERLRSAVADGRGWAFLAITEPDVGSDATALRTELRPAGDGTFRLYGVKRYIGNGARARIGVVLARTGPGPLALRAVLVDGASPQLRARPLDMVGLRGAQISELAFDGMPVGPQDLLGEHLSPLRRGMWGVMQGFTTVRVQIAAMAVGTSLAVHEYVHAQRRGWRTGELAVLDRAHAEIAAVHRLTQRAAAAVDADRRHTHPASLAKLAAVSLARTVTRRLPRLLGRGALLEHPLLEKWWRDVCAFEFMEGTSHIQRLHVAQHCLKNGFDHDN
ncbi:acyl-CoA dehydrogenase [Catellatospora methionotrophica]|uniref:Acyl-CoA dehydrogenase n=1 Tax=Catellatospora methionotrophica TaxID=121620 RepID=A0A8J3LIQ3_9ACTN|nr:acyl-CoA dehydrogenase [Catellatospora methionotrophica]GIG18980.1 acyl-CoA dehydrogenase [Catellatospora methionotrophica]